MIIKLFMNNRGQIRLLNSKTTDLDWFYQKLKLAIRDLQCYSQRCRTACHCTDVVSGDCSCWELPFTANGHFSVSQELYQAKPVTVQFIKLLPHGSRPFLGFVWYYSTDYGAHSVRWLPFSGIVE